MVLHAEKLWFSSDVILRNSGLYVSKKGRIGAFLELHIEQGPVLESLDAPIGIVSGISGPLWLTVEMTGFAGHAGSVPMSMRQDALLGSAKIIVALNELSAVRSRGSDGRDGRLSDGVSGLPQYHS